MSPRVPVSRRERPAKPALSREGIVATAVAVMRAEGLEKVTMRRLAKELDTGPASLYVYVAGMAELHAAVLDELLGEVDLDPAGETWRDRLAGVLASCTGVLFQHPALARAAISVRPAGENYLALVEKLLALLKEGGADDRQAAWGVDLLLQLTTASAAEHSTRDQAGRTEAEWSQVTRALQTADARTHPHIHALAGELISGSPQARFDWFVDVLTAGILH
ncbi:TetR/AcrR family transcriptional regulator [Amycolatopsis acidicola]|uniref:TetR/AcrR family transcriptional regulator n=1 Tax=Amycolatopsis acidicola TaxID=2596893 RepID=A0A5N0UIY9_9PSEU|nr:TetR/AcrR family transcriptional regulator [Amycolatopsis acidicola]KAA9148919.1 TetR/AcrR family transcriptional regulator [Amycolatopsis acidicola]